MRGGRVRTAVAADAPALAAIVTAGLQTYTSFAPKGWEPAAATGEVARFEELLAAGSGYRCWVGEDGDGPVGVAGYLPAARSGPHPVQEPGLAHLRHLFVLPRAWGGTMAHALHAAAIERARADGFTAMRLFCASGQARARRFYEREGWRLTGLELAETPLGLSVVEYRRAL